MNTPNFDLFTVDSAGVKNFGWKHLEVKDAWEKVKGNFNPFKIVGAAPVKKKTRFGGEGRRRFLHPLVRKVVGQDLLNWAQRAGSCVAEGAGSACNYLACTNIALFNKSEKFRRSYVPYHYGTMRVFIGAKYGVNFGFNDDGGIGSFMAEAVKEYGNLFADTPGVEPYQGEADIARRWGYRPGPKKEFITEAKKYLVKTTARITNWEQLVEAVTNGYPCTIASMLSFQMNPNSAGFHEQTSEGWAHQMCIIGWWNHPTLGEIFYVLNSWGPDTHGTDPAGGPPGGFWVKKSDVDYMCNDEVFILSQWDGFPAQELSWFI
jgi:hypothetical protein